MSHSRIAAAATVVAALVLAACSGVPRSTAPHVVSSVQVLPSSPQPTITPIPGASPEEIVRGFLLANATSDPRHSAARSFLTADEQRTWNDSVATVIDTVPVPSGRSSNLTGTANLVGKVDKDGKYTPQLVGDGSSGQRTTFDFTMKKVGGQWRIDKLGPFDNLIITQAALGSTYIQRQLYFLNPTQSRVVPDIRYSSILDQLALANWLLSELVSGPREEMQNAVISGLPRQESADPRRGAVVTVSGTSVRVNVPLAGPQTPPVLTMLAKQVALTLNQALPSDTFTVTDGQRQVSIPGHPAGFTAAEFQGSSSAPEPLFFVNSAGQVVNDHGIPLPGVLSRGRAVNAVALASSGSPNHLVAVTYRPASGARLEIGHLDDDALRAAALPAGSGALSRPVWAPQTQQPEVWVGSYSTGLLCVQTGSGDLLAHPVLLNPGTGNSPLQGRVSALQFSPDGARVAIALNAPASPTGGPTVQVWVGSVVRSGTQVQVSGLEPITPPAVRVADVAWNDATTLYLIGTDLLTGDFGIWDVQSDGSGWKRRTTDELPAAPTSITTTLDAFPVVSAAGRIWEQHSSWDPLLSNASAGAGTNPTYLQ